MTSRYIDTQLFFTVRVYVRLWVYVHVCVKRAVRPQKAEWKSRVRGALSGVNKAEIASKEGTGAILWADVHTHTNLIKKVSGLFFLFSFFTSVKHTFAMGGGGVPVLSAA